MVPYSRYEILNSLPVYGPMYISVTDNDEPYYSEGFPIKFYKSDGTTWVANFKPGWTGKNGVYDFPEREVIIVIAGGLGYTMNPDKEKPINTFGLTINEIFQTENGSLACADGISFIYLDNTTGELWRSVRISWDGFKDLKLNEYLITGKSYDPTNTNNEWTEFSLNLKTKEVIGGSYKEYERMNPNIPKVELVNTDKKSWWKIWKK